MIADIFGEFYVALARGGHCFVRRWAPNKSTIDIGLSIGEVVNIERLLPGSGIPIVQRVVPRAQSTKFKNQYSGTFGLEPFPLHTDLAHWLRPPRFVLLRCIRGTPTVKTFLLPVHVLEMALGRSAVRRGLVRPRHIGRALSSVLLPLTFCDRDEVGFRWDSLFLTPANDSARRVSQILQFDSHLALTPLDFILQDPGDSLIIDNWRCMHGRSAVTPEGTERLVERLYISRLNS